MHRNVWKTGLILTLALAMAGPAWAGIEQTQLQAVKDLALETFGLPVATPASPCSGGASACACGTPPCGCTQLTTGSVNQKLLARTWYYGWTLRHNPGDKACAQGYINEHLTNQQNNGHYSYNANTDEILTTSHFQLYAGAMAGVYLFALTNGNNWSSPLPAPDTTVLTPARRWWLDEKALWDALRVSNQIDAPGARFPVGTIPPMTNMTYRNFIDGQLRNVRPSPLPPQWATDKYYTGGWILEEMFNRGHNPTNLVAPLSGYTPSVRVHDTLCIYRNGSEWLYYFPQLRNASEPVFWVQNRAGQPHAADPVAGVPITPPVKPANFGISITPTTFPGLKAGALSCPPSTSL